jgi:hypothetical protein
MEACTDLFGLCLLCTFAHVFSGCLWFELDLGPEDKPFQSIQQALVTGDLLSSSICRGFASFVFCYLNHKNALLVQGSNPFGLHHPSQDSSRSTINFLMLQTIILRPLPIDISFSDMPDCIVLDHLITPQFLVLFNLVVIQHVCKACD